MKRMFPSLTAFVYENTLWKWEDEATPELEILLSGADAERLVLCEIFVDEPVVLITGMVAPDTRVLFKIPKSVKKGEYLYNRHHPFVFNEPTGSVETRWAKVISVDSSGVTLSTFTKLHPRI